MGSTVVRFSVVGNPDNRRVALFAAAVRAAGLPDPVVVPWRDVLRGKELPIPRGDDAPVRVESPGEDTEVDRLLRGAATPADHGELVGFADWYAGFTAALGKLTATGAWLVPDPADVAVLFDKRACHARLRAAGVPVPESPGPVASWDELAAYGSGRWFVKPAHGSSASGVVALAVASGNRAHAVTSVEMADGRLYNNLRLRRYPTVPEVAALIDALAATGPLHVERWFPKATFAGKVIDLRVVVIDGTAAHVVVRSSRSPITNLHLGNARGDAAALRTAMGEAAWSEMLVTARAAAACFRGCLQVGVDVMVSRDLRRFAIAEANAFGDLLPGVLDGHGRDTYAAQVAAIRGWENVP